MRVLANRAALTGCRADWVVTQLPGMQFMDGGDLWSALAQEDSEYSWYRRCVAAMLRQACMHAGCGQADMTSTCCLCCQPLHHAADACSMVLQQASVSTTSKACCS